MNSREALKAHVLTCMLEGKMTVKEGAERLGLSERQVKRLKKRGKENGVTSILYRNCGRQPKQKILEVKEREEYAKVNFTHFTELLEREEGIKISYFALRKLLLENGYFFSTKEPTLEEQLTGKGANKTQFGTMMESLGVHMIHARSSQAKGRIEREGGTLQRRIETEFAIRGGGLQHQMKQTPFFQS